MDQDSTTQSIGPIIHFRGERDGRAGFAIVTASTARDAPVLSLADETFPMKPLGKLAGMSFFAHPVEVPLGPRPQRRVYGLGARPFAWHIPSQCEALRLAYASCNGAEGEDFSVSAVSGRNDMWTRLLDHHEETPFHLLVMGGDQVYADGVWSVPALARWREMQRKERLSAAFTAEMAAQAEAFYLELYRTVWTQTPVARALAVIPVLMMWDDHDIFDGWGSRPRDLQRCPVFRGVFGIARKAFALCQLGCDPDRLPRGFGDGEGSHFGWSGDYGPAHIVVPDLRSERTRRRVLGEPGARFLKEALDPSAAESGSKPPGKLRTLLLVSSIPMVNVDLSVLERVVEPLMPWFDLYQDDLRDQWTSYAHAAEWRAVMEQLFEWADQRGPVAVLSGEIHLAALGAACRRSREIVQFIASGIAHPPPPPSYARTLDRLARRTRFRGDIAMTMRPVKDGKYFLSERNWLEVEISRDGGTSAILHAEMSGRLTVYEIRAYDPAAVPARHEGCDETA